MKEHLMKQIKESVVAAEIHTGTPRKKNLYGIDERIIKNMWTRMESLNLL